MNPIEILPGVYLVELPEGAIKIKFSEEYNLIWYEIPPMRGWLSIPLPDTAYWQFLFTTDQMTEEQAATLVTNRVLSSKDAFEMELMEARLDPKLNYAVLTNKNK